MKGYCIEEIMRAVNGELITKSTEQRVNRLLIDSRKVIAPDDSVFFALKGQHHDGHDYLPELRQKGVQTFVISDRSKAVDDANTIYVKDTLAALQQLAAFHRNQFQIPIIGVTGSNGKTIIKEWLFQLLADDRVVIRSPKSYNSQVGVPLSVWQMNESHELGIFEAGISQLGEMQKLQKIIQPTIGVFANIGEPHDQNFEDREQKVKEKMSLFKKAKMLIYCADHKEIAEYVPDCETLTWSVNGNGDLQVESVDSVAGCSKIGMVFQENHFTIKIPFTDDASIENAVHCCTLLLYLGYEPKVIRERMKRLVPVAMRLDLKEGINNSTLINDSYNSDVGSLAIALDFLAQQNQHAKKTLILSDILQGRDDEASLYKRVAELVNAKGVVRLIGVGQVIGKHQKLFTVKEQKFYPSTESLLQDVGSNDVNNEAILIKGARPFGFEKIVRQLEHKNHRTVLEINLDAVVHNLNWVRSQLKLNTKIMAMVKAFAYGSGSYEIANILQFHRVDYLAVAYVDEGVALRQAGITVPIMVMNPEPQSYHVLLKYRLEPELYNRRTLDSFAEIVRTNLLAEQLPFLVHVKLDTGMHRQGFMADDTSYLIEIVSNNPYIKVGSLFSHLAASDDQNHDDFTREQINQFEEMSEAIMHKLEYPVLRHMLNSAGMQRFPEAQFDMVRIGIALHGVGNDRLKQVSTLKTTISQIREVKKGETVGYDRFGQIDRDSRIATVAIGYADGLSRKLGNGNGEMLVRGRQVPIIGNVCMDMCMLDITGIDAEEGDEVIVFGGDYPITEFAMKLGTIPYEVLTGVSARVNRVYYKES